MICQKNVALHKIGCALIALYGLTACGHGSDNDPIYQQLKANPPTEIPARHVPKLKQGLKSCDVFNEGKLNQYLTCWSPNMGLVKYYATQLYYHPNPLHPPRPDMSFGGSGKPVSQKVPLR